MSMIIGFPYAARHLKGASADDRAPSEGGQPDRRRPDARAPAPVLARSEPTTRPTIFHEPWWLDACTAGQIEEAQVHQGGRLVGRLPYTIESRRGFRVGVMPDLTHVLGPVILEGSGGGNSRWLRRLDIARELAQQLPPLGLFSQVCHPDTSDVAGFQACGFASSVQFTGEIAPRPQHELWAGLRDKTRNAIRRCSERAAVETLDDPQRFRSFYENNLSLRGSASYFKLNRIAPVFEAAHSRGQAQIVCVRGFGSSISAALFYVWDAQRLWYLLSSRNPHCHDSGAVSLLIWHGIREAARRHLIFDFDGIASAGTARFFAGFGATVRPRYGIHRTGRWFEMVSAMASLARNRSDRNCFTAP